jgi:hypothetical protein
MFGYNTNGTIPQMWHPQISTINDILFNIKYVDSQPDQTLMQFLSETSY